MAKQAAPPSVFARRLAEARQRAGLSQRDLGLLAGMEPSVASPRVNQYEHGKHEPRGETLQRLAEALGVPAAYLLTDDELLARLLLQWKDLTVRQKKQVLKDVEAALAAKG